MAKTIKTWDGASLLAVPIKGANIIKGLKKGRNVSAGQLLALSANVQPLGIHSPINGIIEDISHNEIIIERNDAAVGEPPQKKDLHHFSGQNLVAQLALLGLQTPEIYPGDDLIVSTLDPEPGLFFSQAIFNEHRVSVNAALEAIRRIWPNKKIIWAVRQLIEKMEDQQYLVDATYPHCNPANIKKRIFRRNDHKAAGVLNAAYLFMLGRLWRTGLPLTSFPLSVGKSSYFIPLGTRIIDLLSFANLYPAAGDTVIIGGLIKGHSISRLNQGLDYHSGALNLIRRRDVPHAGRCRGCGLCHKNCPVGIDLDFLGSLDLNECVKLNLTKIFKNCLLCGYCSYICPVGRPLFSLARLGKKDEQQL